MEDEREVTPGGSEVFRHEVPQEEPPIEMEAPVLEPVQDHVERHLGEVHMVFHELVSPYVHLDVLELAPTDERPHWTLITCGMSARPMEAAPEDAPRHLELMLSLPPDWKLSTEDFEDERWYWPVRLLKMLGRLPHEYSTWLGIGHTIPNDDPPEPYAPGTELCGAIILPPLLVPDDFAVLERPGEDAIHFLAAVPLYGHEMDFKLQHGTDALIEAWHREGVEVSELVDPQRASLPPGGGRRRKRFGIF